jgi:hypothetical protein
MFKCLNRITKSNSFTKTFCSKEKIRNEEILLYIMNDKYSVKPDKEFRISHKTIEKTTDDKKTTKVVLYYGKKLLKKTNTA